MNDTVHEKLKVILSFQSETMPREQCNITQKGVQLVQMSVNTINRFVNKAERK